MSAHTPEAGCPTWETLAGFSKGLLSIPELETVAAHLSDCVRCETVLRDFDEGPDPDTLVALLANEIGAPLLLDEPGWGRLQAAAEGLVQAGDTPNSTVAERGKTQQVTPWHGRTIGHYEVLEELGQGGMGVVYRARQQPLGRDVALKMILAGQHADRMHRARFMTEGKAVARLEHPYVVRIYDFAEHEGLAYYTMELVEGESLKARLQRGPLEPREAAELVQKLALAIEHAHQHQVLHRDLKPGNVMLAASSPASGGVYPHRLPASGGIGPRQEEASGSGPQAAVLPKITDFGLAKLLDADGQEATASDILVGTVLYVSPEQAEGRGADIGRGVDVWALGVILYECLTGRVPFRGDNTLKTLELIRHAEPIPPSSRRRGISRHLDDICLTCLEKPLGARYPSAGALADDLERWLQGGRPAATRPWPRRLGRSLRRAARALRRPTALVCLGLAILGSVTAFLRSPGDPTKRSAEEVALERMQRELDAGRPVTLIPETGNPAWFCWQVGESTGKTSSAQDGNFTVHTATLGLVELLPDPRQHSYRLAVQVRHLMSNRTGEVGVYFSRRSSPWMHLDVHFFLQVTFNDVIRKADVVATLPRGAKPPGDNAVRMNPRLFSDEERRPYIDWEIGGKTGPRFKAAGEHRTGWHQLEVTVTPDAVTGRWDGELFSQTTPKIEEQINAFMGRRRLQFPQDSFVQRLRPALDPRGGLGLYVRRGSASFRAVSVTPLVR